METNRITRTFRPLTISSLTLIILLAFACGEAEKPREVGLVVPLSGHAKVYGRSIERGAQLALEQLQELGGGESPFVLAVRDSGSHPQRAAELASGLYDEGAVAVIGGATNGEMAAMAPVAGQAKRVLLSPAASSADLSDSSRYVFRLSPSDYQQAVKMGGFAVLELELARAAVMAPRSDAGHELGSVFRGEFERQGGEIVDLVSYEESDEEDAAKAVERLLEERPDAVYLAASGGDPTALRIVERLASEGFRGTVMTTSAFAAPELLAATGRSTEGLVVSAGEFDTDSEHPLVKAFVDAYRARYDAEPDTFAAQGYDAVMSLAEALASDTSSPRELWQGLRGLAGYQGVTGVIQFDEQGNVSQFPRVYVVQGGKLEQAEGDAARRLARLRASAGVAAAG